MGVRVRLSTTTSLHLGLVAGDQRDLLALALALLLVLDGADDPQRRAARADDVLVRNREEVALLPRVLGCV